jgi:nitrate reductase NapD
MTSVHIASLIVRARPEFAREVASRIAGCTGTEIHAVEDGKIIVVLECPNERALAARMDEMRDDRDVLMVSLVYHEVEDGPIDDLATDGCAAAGDAERIST